MPLADGDIEGDDRAVGAEFDGVGTGVLEIIIELLHQTAAQAHHRLGRFSMPVDRQWRPRLDGVEHTLRLIVRRVPEIQIHP